MKKTIIIILLIAGVIFWVVKSKNNVPAAETNAPTTQNQVDDTEITTINKDIESIDIGNADQDFKDINTDLQGL